jgi:hypothetical protein
LLARFGRVSQVFPPLNRLSSLFFVSTNESLHPLTQGIILKLGAIPQPDVLSKVAAGNLKIRPTLTAVWLADLGSQTAA